MSEVLQNFIIAHQRMIEDALCKHQPLSSQPGVLRLNEAIEYAIFPGGKRIRPVLTLIAAKIAGGDNEPRKFAGSLSVLIPARNEENNLRACLDSVLSRKYVLREVLIYDDHSTDRTSEIINKYAERASCVRKIRTTTLPKGWCGKTSPVTDLPVKQKANGCFF